MLKNFMKDECKDDKALTKEKFHAASFCESAGHDMLAREVR